MTRITKRLAMASVALALLVSAAGLTERVTQAQARVTSPETFFGFQMGADRKLVRWDKAVEYYRLLEKESGGKLKVVEMGPTEMGNPFLLVIVTSPANQARLEELRQMNLKLSDPRGVPEAEIKRIVAEGKVVICQTMSMHASEVGGINMAPELTYDLVSRTDEEARRILDNVVFLEIPSFNPDGAIMIHDYYMKYLGTEYEGGPLPWLYNKYIGHDNNRDALTMNMKDSQYVGKLMFVDWKPQAYVDHHHMGSYGARIFVPPYAEPIRPLADPQVWREMQWYGGHIAYKEEEAGLSGVSNTSQYSGWGHFGFHWITPFHNIAGMLTESASVRVATPLYIDPSQLSGGARGLETYKEQMNFPNPWPGGWWTLRGVVERQKVSAWATLDLAARNRETVLWNAYLKASRQTERGAKGKPAAYALSANQHDPLTLNKLVNALLAQGIEVLRSGKGFAAPDGMTYPAGSFYVPLAQPKMGLVRYLLGETHYMDNEHTRRQDGTPIRPYDMGQDVLAEFMGIRADPLDEAVTGDFTKVAAPIVAAGKVAAKGAARIRPRREAERQLPGGQPVVGQGHRGAAREHPGRRPASGRLDRAGRAGCRCRRRRPAGGRGLQPAEGRRDSGSLRRQAAAHRHVSALSRRQHGRGLDALALRTVGVPVQRGLRRGDPQGQPQREIRRVHLRRRLDGRDHG